MTTSRSPRLRRPWWGRVLGAWFAGVAFGFGWRVAGAPPWGRDGMGMDGSWRTTELPTLVVACGFVAAAAVLVARKWPLVAHLVVLATAAVYAVAVGVPGGAFGAVPALAMTTASLVVARGASRAWPWLLPIVPVHLASGWAHPLLGLGDPKAWANLLSLLAWTLFPTLVTLLVVGRREARHRARAEELRQVAADERLRIARDIHDVVGHSLSMISLQSGVALRVLEADPAQARASLEAIRTSSRDALAEVRRTLGVFRDADAPLAPTPDLAALGSLVAEARTGGVRVTTSVTGAEGVPPATQAVAYRVVQEGLTNAVRHAPGAPITVAVRREGPALVVTVSDAGGAATIVEGSGLRGMRERVEALGGRLDVGATASGAVVEARLPLEGET